MFEGRRDDYFPHLMSWARDHAASCEGFAVTNFGAEGYGLRATRDIKVRPPHTPTHTPVHLLTAARVFVQAEELFLWIPRKMLMTVESAKKSVLGKDLICEAEWLSGAARRPACPESSDRRVSIVAVG